MKHDGAAGAMAATEYFWDTAYYLQITGDTGPMSEVSTDECGGCAALMEHYPPIYEDSTWLVTSPPIIESNRVRIVDSYDGYWLATQVVSISDVRHFISADEELDEVYSPPTPDVPWLIGLTYDRDSSHWVVSGIENYPEESD